MPHQTTCIHKLFYAVWHTGIVLFASFIFAAPAFGQAPADLLGFGDLLLRLAQVNCKVEANGKYVLLTNKAKQRIAQVELTDSLALVNKLLADSAAHDISVHRVGNRLTIYYKQKIPQQKFADFEVSHCDMQQQIDYVVEENKWTSQTSLNATFQLVPFSSLFKLEATFRATDSLLRIEKARVFDNKNYPLYLSGQYHAPSKNWTIAFQADSFQLFHSLKGDIYGTLLLKAQGTISGTEKKIKTVADVDILQKSFITYDFRTSNDVGSERVGLVEFIGPVSGAGQKQPLKIKDRLEVNLNISIPQSIKVKSYANTNYNDYTQVFAEGKLNYRFRPKKGYHFLGALAIDSGEVIDGRFVKTLQVQAEGQLFWEGNSLFPLMDVETIYRVKARPMRLFSVELAPRADAEKIPYRKKVPFDVYIRVSGPINQPIHKFAVKLPPSHRSVLGGELQTKLNFVNESEHQSKLQATSLLGFKRFAGSKLDGARVSRVQYIGKYLIKALLSASRKKFNGYDFRFDYYAYDDYGQINQETSRRELELSLSKEYLENRLRFELSSVAVIEKSANQQIDNFWQRVFPSGSMTYYFTPEGTLFGKLYSETNYTGILDGRIRNSGFDFGFSKSFDSIGLK